VPAIGNMDMNRQKRKMYRRKLKKVPKFRSEKEELEF
jgi:hypothetical protein